MNFPNEHFETFASLELVAEQILKHRKKDFVYNRPIIEDLINQYDMGLITTNEGINQIMDEIIEWDKKNEELSQMITVSIAIEFFKKQSQFFMQVIFPISMDEFRIPISPEYAAQINFSEGAKINVED